jgi:S1-C subfamily serine protease
MSNRAPLHSIRLRIIIAASAVAILLVGYALRPQAELPAPAVEEQPSPILRDVVERREAASVYVTLQQTARTVAHLTARVTPTAAARERWSDWKPDPLERRRHGGVVDGRTLLADAADLPVGSMVAAQLGNGRVVHGVVSAIYPRAGLALITVEAADALPVPTAATVVPTAGELGVAVAPGEEGLLTVPVVIVEVRRSGLYLSGAMEAYRGVPVFNARGEWLGAIADGDGGMRVVRPRDLAGESANPPAPPPLGLSLELGPAEFAAPSPAEAGRGRRGAPREPAGAGPQSAGRGGTDNAGPVVVTDLAPDGRAAMAGFQSGDVILEIDGAEPADLETVVAALRKADDAPIAVRVRRGQRTLVLRVEPTATDSR